MRLVGGKNAPFLFNKMSARDAPQYDWGSSQDTQPGRPAGPQHTRK
jgi:hypothetical protein